MSRQKSPSAATAANAATIAADAHRVARREVQKRGAHARRHALRRRQHLERPHRLLDVLDAARAGVDVARRDLEVHLVVDGARDQHAARLCERLQPRGDVDRVAGYAVRPSMTSPRLTPMRRRICRLRGTAGVLARRRLPGSPARTRPRSRRSRTRPSGCRRRCRRRGRRTRAPACRR